MESHQVPLFDPEGDEDVSGCRGGEQEMPDGHHRRSPKREDEAEHDGMTHIAIEAGNPEANRCVRTPGSIEIDLSEAEQVKWSIKNVDTSTMAQPAQKTAWMNQRPTGFSTCQTTAGIGRHCQKRRPRARLLTST